MDSRMIVLCLVFVAGTLPLWVALFLIFGFAPGRMMRARAEVISARTEWDAELNKLRVLVKYRFQSLNGEMVTENQVGVSQEDRVTLGHGPLKGYRVGGWNIAVYDLTDPRKGRLYPDQLRPGLALLFACLAVGGGGVWYVLS